MFEKIFGIFTKRKKTDVSQEIPGDFGVDTFGGDTGLEEDFDADTISLETGMSGDSGFSDTGAVSAGPQDLGSDDMGTGTGEFGEAGQGLGIEEPAGGDFQMEAPISPAPEGAPFVTPRRKSSRLKGILTIAGVVVVGFAAGFFGAKPLTNVVQKTLSKGPTPAEQLTALETENTQMDSQLTAYRAVGNIEAITAIQEELKKRSDINGEINSIDTKVADQPVLERRLETNTNLLDQTNRDLMIQKGALANVEKAVKQAEARNDYLTSSTRRNLELIDQAEQKSEVLKARLLPESVERAEAAGALHYSIRKNLEESASEALSSSS